MDESKFAIPNKIRRNKKVNYRCPRWAATKMLSGGLIKKHELRSYQELFEYLIVSGVIYLRPEIINFVKIEIVKYKTRSTQSYLSRFGKAERPVYDRYMQLQSFMFEQDFHALNNFCIENNVKPVWVYHCLFVDGFCNENPIILDLIKDCKDKKIRSRKNVVARLVKDKYIEVLGAADCQMLLSHLTKKFDKKEFESNLISEVISLENQLSKEETKNEIDEELDAKINSIRKSREKELDDAVEPVDEPLTSAN